MVAVFRLVPAIFLALALHPAFAQSQNGSAMPPGTQNPALAQPRLVAPPELTRQYQPAPTPSGTQPQAAPSYQPAPTPGGAQPQLAQPYQPGPTPGGFQPGPTPNQPAPSALIGPDGAGGLCECLISHDPAVPTLDKTKMHQTCLASLDACQAACNTQTYFSFVPHALYTCPGHPLDRNNIALNARRSVRLLSR